MSKRLMTIYENILKLCTICLPCVYVIGKGKRNNARLNKVPFRYYVLLSQKLKIIAAMANGHCS